MPLYKYITVLYYSKICEYSSLYFYLERVFDYSSLLKFASPYLKFIGYFFKAPFYIDNQLITKNNVSVFNRSRYMFIAKLL